MTTAKAGQDAAREPLSGVVERVTFHSTETGYCVLRVKVRGHRDLVTVLGSAAEVHAGESIQASGQWQQHREHGLQFRASFLQVVPPSSIEGIRRYLGSGMIKGIGPHFAGRLVAAFGETVFDVIERTPERLLEVDGIGKTRLGRITAGWSEQKAIREIMVFLQSHGVGTSRSVRIYKTYGADAVPLVKANPIGLHATFVASVSRPPTSSPRSSASPRPPCCGRGPESRTRCCRPSRAGSAACPKTIF
jgi:exodeoxyribonuclease V alpha subunit